MTEDAQSRSENREVGGFDYTILHYTILYNTILPEPLDEPMRLSLRRPQPRCQGLPKAPNPCGEHPRDEESPVQETFGKVPPYLGRVSPSPWQVSPLSGASLALIWGKFRPYLGQVSPLDHETLPARGQGRFASWDSTANFRTKKSSNLEFGSS